MGDVIQLHERRRARRCGVGPPRERSRATFYFDLACPFTYLAAERVERAFDEVVWTPASDGALRRSCLADDAVGRRGRPPRGRGARGRAAHAARVAGALPDRGRRPRCASPRGRRRPGAARPSCSPRRGSRSAAASTSTTPRSSPRRRPPRASRSTTASHAARDAGRDGAIERAGRALLAAGADRLPALRVGRALYWGERARGRGAHRGQLARVAQASRRALARALRGDEPGEDLGVEGVDRLGLVRRRRRAGSASGASSCSTSERSRSSSANGV